MRQNKKAFGVANGDCGASYSCAGEISDDFDNNRRNNHSNYNDDSYRQMEEPDGFDEDYSDDYREDYDGGGGGTCSSSMDCGGDRKSVV